MSLDEATACLLAFAWRIVRRFVLQNFGQIADIDHVTAGRAFDEVVALAC